MISLELLILASLLGFKITSLSIPMLLSRKGLRIIIKSIMPNSPMCPRPSLQGRQIHPTSTKMSSSRTITIKIGNKWICSHPSFTRLHPKSPPNPPKTQKMTHYSLINHTSSLISAGRKFSNDRSMNFLSTLLRSEATLPVYLTQTKELNPKANKLSH